VQNQAAAGGSTGDGVEVSCSEVDISGYTSAQIVIHSLATLGASETLSFETQHAEGSVSTVYGSDAVIEADTVVQTGAVTGVQAVHGINIDLTGYARYQQFKITPSLSSTGTLTRWSAVIMLFGKGRDL
jgi:hypothetical protein